jgi:hypothetical protein
MIITDESDEEQQDQRVVSCSQIFRIWTGKLSNSRRLRLLLHMTLETLAPLNPFHSGQGLWRREDTELHLHRSNAG